MRELAQRRPAATRFSSSRKNGTRVGETRSATYLRRLEALNELATAVNSTLDAREVCQRALPLVHRGEPIGSLLIAWPEPTVLSADELEFCRNVGLQLSNALANARLYETQVLDRQRLAEKNLSLEHSSTRSADRARGREQ